MSELFNGAALDKLFGFGEKLLDQTAELSSLNAEAVKKLGVQQADLAAAFVELGSKQYELVSGARNAEELLRRQTEAGEALRARITTYAEALRGIGEELREGYVAFAKGFLPTGAA